MRYWIIRGVFVLIVILLFLLVGLGQDANPIEYKNQSAPVEKIFTRSDNKEVFIE